MSDVMMFGIAKMPYELAMRDELSRRQFYANTQRLVAALEAAQAEVDEWKRVAAAQAELYGEAEERAEQLAEDDAWCAECGVKLENVRPGKYQHPTCSQAQPLKDEALLRQALEALELRCGTHADERKELIPALRERLGVRA